MTEIRDQQFQRTERVATRVGVEPSLEMAQDIYPLCEADFLRLKSPRSKTLAAAIAIMLAGVGSLLPLAGKYVQALLSGKMIPIETWEWYAPAIAVITGLIMYVVGRIVPSERRRVLQKIKDHFATSPRRHRIRRK
jgi:zinc transporter ZupT